MTKVCYTQPSACLLLLVIIAGSVMATAQGSVPTTPEMAIDQIKKTVLFIQTDWVETQTQTPGSAQPSAVQLSKSQVGTAFLIWIQFPDSDLGITYLVTAKHMIRQKLPN